MADAHNIALNQRLEESLGTVDKVMLALPPPSGDAGPTRRSWHKEKGTARMDSPFFPQSVQFTWNLNSSPTLAFYQGQSVS